MTADGLHFGFTDEQWVQAREEMRNILSDLARAQSRIAYSSLVSRLQSVHLEPDSYALAHLLGEISESEDAAGRGMLSVIVVHKDGDMQPGPGFFELAKKRGRDTSDILRCWIEEFNRVHAYWRDN